VYGLGAGRDRGASPGPAGVAIDRERGRCGTRVGRPSTIGARLAAGSSRRPAGRGPGGLPAPDGRFVASRARRTRPFS